MRRDEHAEAKPRRHLCRPAVALLALVAAFWAGGARADIAPPEQPPGSNISPGSEQTQVVMASERVVIEVMPSGETAVGSVSAEFNMRNSGTSEEKMQVRFPLGNPSGRSSGFGDFPEVVGFKAAVGGQAAATIVITTPNPLAGQGEDEPIKWAAFDVTFPAGQEVKITATYGITATGYPPSARFAYVLETGAGWKDAIGSADVIVRFPYEVAEEAVFDGEGETSPGGQVEGREVRWHFENLEPSGRDNIYITTVTPQVWQKIAAAREEAQASPGDADAHFVLAWAYAEAITSRAPYEENDRFALLAEEEMRRAVAARPDSANLRVDFAKLIWGNIGSQALLSPDNPKLKQVLSELGAALALDPGNESARLLLSEIETSVEGTVTVPTPSVQRSPTAVELPTAGRATRTAALDTPVPEETPVPPTPDVQPSPASATATPTVVPPGAADDNNLLLIIGLIALPVVVAAAAYAVVASRRRGPSIRG